MQKIDYKVMKPTRDYLQDVAKIIGKAQQVFLPVDPNYWHVGLEVTESGLSSQALPGNDRVILDTNTGLVRTKEVSWALLGLSSHEIMGIVQRWLKAKGVRTEMQVPELTTSTPKPNLEQIKVIAGLFVSAQKILAGLKPRIKGGVVSPVLLYPHHFDLALSWYPDRQSDDETDKRHQYTLGFSTGDKNIPEPYFYATSYPEADELKNRPLPRPAYWHSRGFSGAVLKYNDIAELGDPEKQASDFFSISVSLEFPEAH